MDAGPAVHRLVQQPPEPQVGLQGKPHQPPQRAHQLPGRVLPLEELETHCDAHRDGFGPVQPVAGPLLLCEGGVDAGKEKRPGLKTRS